MAFDVITPNKLGQNALDVAGVIVYTVPSLTRTIVKTIDIANINGTTVTSTVYLVPFGEVISKAATLIPNITIPSNSIFQWAGSQVLNEGDSIQALSSKSNVTINISGAECT